MTQESINDKAISTLAMARDVGRLMEGVNDYAKGTGFCDEHEQIINDFHSQLGSIRGRLSRLERRIKNHNESNTEDRRASQTNDQNTTMTTENQNIQSKPAAQALSDPAGSVGCRGDFYDGIEWMASWMLDNVEGEPVDELTLRGWAVDAWRLHLEKQNA